MCHIALLAAAAAPLACENTVDPFVETDAHAFAVSGYLDMGSDTQLVRIAPIRPGDAHRPLPDAVVTTELESGTEVKWRDSVVTLDDGSEGLLFYAALVPEAGVAYAMEIRRGDGPPLRAFTRLPPRPDFDPGEPRLFGRAVAQTVTWEPVTSPVDVRVRYRLQAGGEDVEIVVPYDRLSYGVSDGRLAVTSNLTRDFETIRVRMADRVGAEPIHLLDLTMQVRTLSAEWADPTEPANIENGEGFFGSVGQFSGRWTIPDSLAERVGYAPGP